MHNYYNLRTLLFASISYHEHTATKLLREY